MFEADRAIFQPRDGDDAQVDLGARRHDVRAQVVLAAQLFGGLQIGHGGRGLPGAVGRKALLVQLDHLADDLVLGRERVRGHDPGNPRGRESETQGKGDRRGGDVQLHPRSSNQQTQTGGPTGESNSKRRGRL